jgi:hypothetical protein
MYSISLYRLLPAKERGLSAQLANLRPLAEKTSDPTVSSKALTYA